MLVINTLIDNSRVYTLLFLSLNITITRLTLFIRKYIESNKKNKIRIFINIILIAASSIILTI